MRTRLLRALLAVLVISLPQLGCDDECSLSDRAESRAGEPRVACGTVALGESWAPGFDCAVEAFERGDAFHVLLEQQGTDSRVVRAWVGNREGRVWTLLSDDYGGTVTISESECLNPVVEPIGPSAAVVQQGLVDKAQRVFGCGSSTTLGPVCE